MAKQTTTKKRNPQDATRRNVQAANKRYSFLRARVLIVEDKVGVLARTVDKLLAKIG